MEDPITGPTGLVSVAEAQRLLSVGRTTIYALIKGGKLRAVKLGRRTLFVRAELDAFVAALPRRDAQDTGAQRNGAAQGPCSSADDRPDLSTSGPDQLRPDLHEARQDNALPRASQ